MNMRRNQKLESNIIVIEVEEEQIKVDMNLSTETVETAAQDEYWESLASLSIVRVFTERSGNNQLHLPLWKEGCWVQNSWSLFQAHIDEFGFKLFTKDVIFDT